MTGCIGKKRPDVSTHSGSTSDPLVESDPSTEPNSEESSANSSFGDQIPKVRSHADIDPKLEIRKMTSSMTNPDRASNKCNLL